MQPKNYSWKSPLLVTVEQACMDVYKRHARAAFATGGQLIVKRFDSSDQTFVN